MKKNQEKFEKVLKTTEMANDYIRLHTVYEYAMSYKKQDKDYVLPKEAEIFLNIQNELNITSIDEAKELIKKSRLERIEINKQRKEVLELQRELNHLETIKEEKETRANEINEFNNSSKNELSEKLSKLSKEQQEALLKLLER